jgi:hypothetical protein
MRFPCVDATGTKVWSERRGDLAEAATRANLFLRSPSQTSNAVIHVIVSKQFSMIYEAVFDTTGFNQLFGANSYESNIERLGLFR